MRRAVLPFLLLLPVACAQPQPADPAAALQDAMAAHRASLAGLGGLPAAAPAANTSATVEPALRGARPAAPAPTPAGPAPSLASQLVGQTPETVLGWLGAPRLRREEGPAEIWHYQASQCHLDLVLYPEDGPQPVLRVAFAAARSVGTARRAEAACLRDIARGAARPPSGPGEPSQTG